MLGFPFSTEPPTHERDSSLWRLRVHARRGPAVHEWLSNAEWITHFLLNSQGFSDTAIETFEFLLIYSEKRHSPPVQPPSPAPHKSARATPAPMDAGDAAPADAGDPPVGARSGLEKRIESPPNFERLVLGCIIADLSM